MVETPDLDIIVGICLFGAQRIESLSFQFVLPEATPEICLFYLYLLPQPSVLLNLFSPSDWLARPLSLQMFTDWIMELSLLLLRQSIAFPHRTHL